MWLYCLWEQCPDSNNFSEAPGLRATPPAHVSWGWYWPVAVPTSTDRMQLTSLWSNVSTEWLWLFSQHVNHALSYLTGSARKNSHQIFSRSDMPDTVDMTINIIHLYLISTGKCYMGNHINKRFRALIWTGIIIVYCEGSMSCCDNYPACNEYQTSDVGGQAVYTIPLKLAPTLAMYLTTKVVCRSLTYSVRKHWLCGLHFENTWQLDTKYVPWSESRIGHLKASFIFISRFGYWASNRWEYYTIHTECFCSECIVTLPNITVHGPWVGGIWTQYWPPTQPLSDPVPTRRALGAVHTEHRTPCTQSTGCHACRAPGAVHAEHWVPCTCHLLFDLYLLLQANT